MNNIKTGKAMWLSMTREMCLFTGFFLIAGTAFAQVRPITGEYHLQGVMETATALLLKRDSTFELYFSYGAIDRKGAGKWSMVDGVITLNSRPRPATDFELVEAKSTEDPLTTVKILSSNPQLFPFFEITLRSASGDAEGKPNAEGLFRTAKLPVTTIEIFFSLCPERFSSFPIKDSNNHYTFKILPWISEVFLDNIKLKVGKTGLTGQHPLLRGDQFEYTKAR